MKVSDSDVAGSSVKVSDSAIVTIVVPGPTLVAYVELDVAGSSVKVAGSSVVTIGIATVTM